MEDELTVADKARLARLDDVAGDDLLDDVAAAMADIVDAYAGLAAATDAARGVPLSAWTERFALTHGAAQRLRSGAPPTLAVIERAGP